MSFEIIGASKATWGYWGVKCHPGVLGRQMPPGGIGASNATRGYWGVKCHTGVKRPLSRFMRSQRLGRQRSGASGIRWGGQGSKFGRQGSRSQRSRASKEMNPIALFRNATKLRIISTYVIFLLQCPGSMIFNTFMLLKPNFS